MNIRTFIQVVAFNILILNALNLDAQSTSKDEVLMTINNKDVTVTDFENVYHKNNTINTVDTSKSLDDYLQLFINFKLKVAEAVELGLDTGKVFQRELAGYRQQLAKPYLTDNNVNEQLMKETYGRLQESVCASHILLKCPETASPKDTLKVYNKIMKIRKRIINSKDFSAIASLPGISDDTITRSTGGAIGCFTAMQMVYEFENAAYSMEVEKVSMPIRTRFGYHLIQVSKKEKAKGEVLVAHIMIRTRPNMTQEDSVNQETKTAEIYKKLKAGEDFEKLAFDFSDDKSNASNGGELSWFGINSTPKAFEDAAFSLKNIGDYSAPVRTQFGLHIIKLKDVKKLGNYESLETELKAKLTKLGRFNVGRKALVDTLKVEYNFNENKKAIKILRISRIKKNTSIIDLKQVLFSFANEKMTQGDFEKYATVYQSRTKAIPLEDLYNNFVEESIISYENKQLESKHSKFKSLMQEYYDGMLLFELTDKKVWSKAVKDTVGLQKYYEDNKQSYSWGERANAAIYTASSKKVAKKVKKLAKKNKTEQEILKAINTDSQLTLISDSKFFTKGESDLIDKHWEAGVYQLPEEDGKIIVLHVNATEKNKLKALDEARGAVISDYQNYLEKEWLTDLKAKYKVEVNDQVLKSIK